VRGTQPKEMPAKRKHEVSSTSSNASLADLFSKLSLAASSNDYDRVLDLADQLLKSSPADSRAAKEKITALIKLDRYKEALTFLAESTFLTDQETVLERGFCLYKVGKCVEAAEVLKTASGRAADHIRAQNVLPSCYLRWRVNNRLIEWRTLKWR
jgi:predicted Zn-dependent protease